MLQKQACVIVGMRNGDVHALDQDGRSLPDWFYSTGRMIRQIYVSDHAPNNILIGSEDRGIHVLDRATGKLCSDPYYTQGWIRSVYAGDIDGDAQEEILAGSGDSCLYILDAEGRYQDKVSLGYQIQALFAASLINRETRSIITSSNRKDLFVWTLQKDATGQWQAHKEWQKSSPDAAFDNRLHAIHVIEGHKGSEPKILLGAEDGYLYILDKCGSLLWKRHFGSCIYSVWAADINFDGQMEILVGTEDSGVYAIQVEFSNNLYKRLDDIYKEVMPYEQIVGKNEIMQKLSPREKAVLKDYVGEVPPLRHVHLELEKAQEFIRGGQYEHALSLLLLLRQQNVQYYWPQPVTTRGYIWALEFGHIKDSHKRDIIIGTDEGYIYAINSEQGTHNIIWQKDFKDRVRMLKCIPGQNGELDTILAVLGNQRCVLLDARGETIREQTIEEQDWARSIGLVWSKDQPGQILEILIGMENNRICIWDASFEHQLGSLVTPQGINFIEHVWSSEGEYRIVSGSTDNGVYVHDREGNLKWSYQTQDRIQGLSVKDIDRNGLAEVVVGSRDRNVYVLDHEGHLKWRYRTKRGVLDVTVCDIKLKDDPEEAEERALKVLASSSDGNVYVLTANGDLLWKYQKPHRIRKISANDINDDGKLEIAIASENQLELLQIINQPRLIEQIEHCWQQLLPRDSEKRRQTIMQLTYHENEYIQAFALAKLAGQHQRRAEDFKRFQDALRKEESLEVRRELVRSIVVLCLVPYNHAENTQQARLFLSHLSSDPDPEIRLAIVESLTELLRIEDGLCFEYLEHFTHNVDMWVRHAVVRQLAKLVRNYPERAFQLLEKTVNDEEEWVRQETGRALSRYFDMHPQQIIQDSLALLAARTRVRVLEQISYSAHTPIIKSWFKCLARLLTELNEQTIEDLLRETVQIIQSLFEFDPVYGEELYQVYSEFLQIYQAHKIGALARYQWSDTTLIEDTDDPAYETIRMSMEVFRELREVSEVIRAYERREVVGDRVTSLITAIDIVDAIRLDLQQEEIRQRQAFPRYSLPELVILSILINKHHKIIKDEIYLLRGNARLEAKIRNKDKIRLEEEVAISLLISNKGVSAADNISITLEDGPEFSVVGTNRRNLLQLTTNNAVPVEFIIRPYTTTPRLSFHITYDDAEKRGKREDFADIVTLQQHTSIYQEILNPYTSGTPIRNREMFYGRQDDINSLREKLSSTTANKVVVLSGQRRMGKTSLIYQLTNALTKSPFVPVPIDLQGQALKNMEQLFAGFATRISEETKLHRQITVTVPEAESFQNNPTATFDTFLNEVFQQLPNEKLVLLLDEFDVLQEKIDQGIINRDVLHYLRSLMQHRQGLNFLLVGAPRIKHTTEQSWSVFFNIALYHNLSKLKPADATALITEPIQSSMEYDMLALERVRKLSGDLPYFIHVISEILIGHCNKHKRSYVTINDVNAVLDTILEEQAGCVNWIWNQTASPLEHILLSILAQEKGEEGRIFSLSDISAEFDAQGINYEQEKVLSALHHLAVEDIVEERFNGTQFRIPIGLVKEWLRKMKPPERVIREEQFFD
ncbi:HEAT repeat domain-containing protein [Dictyobacter kobayashii]|uniref:HEAT repeat domain-containing protein n=1 Tax=Dictyobacter kobayashii TaxID=2014872 RepID=UPI001386F006|nr:AAA-like domain-containing protein [Dictyobacter kobayashii]